VGSSATRAAGCGVGGSPSSIAQERFPEFSWEDREACESGTLIGGLDMFAAAVPRGDRGLCLCAGVEAGDAQLAAADARGLGCFCGRGLGCFCCRTAFLGRESDRSGFSADACSSSRTASRIRPSWLLACANLRRACTASSVWSSEALSGDRASAMAARASVISASAAALASAATLTVAARCRGRSSDT
jgi:hypothetical protein